MTKFLNNIFKSVALVGLITTLLIPSVLNLIHSFEHEEHHLIECNDRSDTHLHEIEFDCSFIQLYATPQIYNPIVSWPKQDKLQGYSYTKATYVGICFTDTHINNTPYRGPPQLNS